MKIIDFTADSIVVAAKSDLIQIRHCPTGPAIAHSGCSQEYGIKQKLLVVLGLLGVMLRRYDVVILPPTHVDWRISNSMLKKACKEIVKIVSNQTFLCRLIRKIFIGNKTKIGIIDNSDLQKISGEIIRITNPDVYFMAHLRTSEMKKYQGKKVKIKQLPLLLADQIVEKLRANKTKTEKTHDVFIAGSYHCPERQRQLEASKILTERGYKVLELKERGFDGFVRAIQMCRFGFAGRGLGYFCNRPFEIGAAGAVVITHTPIYQDLLIPFVHEENCLLYPHEFTPSQIADFVENYINQPYSYYEKLTKSINHMIDKKNVTSSLSHAIISEF